MAGEGDGKFQRVWARRLTAERRAKAAGLSGTSFVFVFSDELEGDETRHGGAGDQTAGDQSRTMRRRPLKMMESMGWPEMDENGGAGSSSPTDTAQQQEKRWRRGLGEEYLRPQTTRKQVERLGSEVGKRRRQRRRWERLKLAVETGRARFRRRRRGSVGRSEQQQWRARKTGVWEQIGGWV